MKGRVRRGMVAALAVGLVATWAVTLRPLALGGPATYIVVRGDSMLPTQHTGDLLIVHAAAGYAVGDLVAYRVPAGEIGAGQIVVHRIVGGDAGRGFVMEGDNNPAPDPWSPRAGDVVGTAWFSVPDVGRVIAFVHQPMIAGGLAVSLMVAFGVARAPRRRVVAGA